MEPETITAQQVIDHARTAFENLITRLPETIVYHPDTKVTVETFPHEDGQQLRFILDVIMIDHETTHDGPAEQQPPETRD